jgi:hypothetical protein
MRDRLFNLSEHGRAMHARWTAHGTMGETRS